MRARTSHRMGMVLALTVAVATCILVPASASAYWSVTSAVPGSGGASAATVMQGATPIVTVATQNDITVDWNPTTLSNSTPVTGYTVSRFNTSNVAQTMLVGCAGTITASICVETDVPDGLWTYAVTPRFATNWAGAPSVKSAAVRADATAPTNNVSRTAVSGGSFLTGTTVYYRGATAGSFRLSNALSDTGSGPASSATGTLNGTTTGWSHTPSSVATPTGGPFVSNLFSWAAGTTALPTVGIAGTDNAGNTASTTLSFVPDNTGPSGGAITYADGYTTATSVAVTVGTISDTGAGVTPTGTRQIQRLSATLDGNICAAFGTTWTNVRTNPPVAPTATNLAIVSGNCYQYRYFVTDNVGNQTITTSPNVVKARNYQTVITNTGGILSYWKLADTGTVVDDLGAPSNDGIYFGTPTQNAPGAIVGDTNAATSFDGVDDRVQVARQISTDFSIEVWFKSTQGLGTGTQWFDGAGLVDADVSGGGNDFGLSLMADGRIAAGSGLPDITALSAPGFNDGAWHHVVFTRTAASGTGQLFVDGTLRATVTGGTQALSGSATLTFGAINDVSNFFAGTLDEIAVYTTVLTPAQIANHNASGR